MPSPYNWSTLVTGYLKTTFSVSCSQGTPAPMTASLVLWPLPSTHLAQLGLVIWQAVFPGHHDDSASEVLLAKSFSACQRRRTWEGSVRLMSPLPVSSGQKARVVEVRHSLTCSQEQHCLVVVLAAFAHGHHSVATFEVLLKGKQNKVRHPKAVSETHKANLGAGIVIPSSWQ